MESRCNIIYIMAPHSMNFWNVEVSSLYSWTLPKVPIILKNALDKSSLKLNFLQKKKSGRISLPPQVVKLGVSRDLHSHCSALYFKNSKCLWPLAPFLRESEIYVHWVSGRKFNNFNQLLFEAFFDIIGTFGNIQRQCEPTFSYQYVIIYYLFINLFKK